MLQEVMVNVFTLLAQYVTRSSPLLPDSDLCDTDYDLLAPVWGDYEWQQVSCLWDPSKNPSRTRLWPI